MSADPIDHLQKLNDKMGVCIRNQDKDILFQNDMSVRLCNGSNGQCSKFCMKFSQDVEECQAINQGMRLFKNIEVGNTKMDLLIVHDGQNISTMMYPLNEDPRKAQKQEAFFQSRGLTKSESQIMQMVLQGMKNAEIAEKLFISKATLKTHLNNAYKKLPASMRPSQIRI